MRKPSTFLLLGGSILIAFGAAAHVGSGRYGMEAVLYVARWMLPFFSIAIFYVIRAAGVSYRPVVLGFVVGAITTALAVEAYRAGVSAPVSMSGGRYGGFLNHPNQYGILITSTAPFIAFFLFSPLLRRKLIGASMLMVYPLCLFQCLSKTNIVLFPLCLLVSSVVIALPDLVRVFRRVFLAAGVVVVLLVIGVIGYQVLGEIAPREAQTIETALFDTQNVRSLDDREDIWDDAIQTIKTHPLFGIGPGKSEVYLLHNHAHNLLLQHWIDAGLLGFIGIVCVSLSAFWRSAELIGAAFRAGGPLDEDETIRVLAGVALMFSIVANSMSASLTTAVMTAFVVFVGIAFVNEPLAGEAPEA